MSEIESGSRVWHGVVGFDLESGNGRSLSLEMMFVAASAVDKVILSPCWRMQRLKVREKTRFIVWWSLENIDTR